ncbi:MAG: hypothetical protein US86_C0010G0015 [Candidatus Daviesbacteria bacterium GW2011_GWA2_38_24]|uniref:L,D-TPase catalytic domain-containing protein n=1 Tax=Candidatus Daviesbacteria bacterium GW2011_GWA2_38_24 TaxID=1618422 RepID=A0A0G0MKT1_9BACT|nr:MAG: hypothetical protein US86_C0010G0015 [Candidatus Daviesbacteria bacterium GW2011_GWA2_38_24]KKQ78547.1 MAG: hypothetical protein UT01_C0067G0009 [Candidatus Daviesbacteria bacterium GW2011_GWA1_38_7]
MLNVLRKILLSLVLLLTFSLAIPLEVNAQTTQVQSQKRVEVDLTNQRLYAYDGNTLIYNFPISSGKPWWPTPTGEFRGWIKLKSTRMVGGSKQYGTYYNLPNVPYVIYFENSRFPRSGYAIHGAYWHNNFGVPMSHGCVNLRPSDSEKIFNWAPTNILIRIYGVTPR